MTKHTKGQWDIIPQTKGFIIKSTQKDTSDYIIATVHNINKNKQNINNANLIVAAPELLEALKMAVKYMGMAVSSGALDNCAIPGANALRHLEAAIAKAEGNTK